MPHHKLLIIDGHFVPRVSRIDVIGITGPTVASACGGSDHSLADAHLVAGMRARASQKGKLERTEGQALLLTQQRKEVTEEEDLKTADGKAVHKVVTSPSRLSYVSWLCVPSPPLSRP